MTDCMVCNNANATAYQRMKRSQGDYKFLLRSRAAGIKRDCKTRKGGAIEVSPELGDILCELWERQEGRCAYTDLPMTLGTGLYQKNDPNYCTADRLDSSMGYVRGNLVLCRCSVNRAKQDMTLRGLFEFCQRLVDNKKSIEEKIQNLTN